MIDRRRNGVSAIQRRTEIALRIPNDLNVLSQLFAALGMQRHNICAFCFYSNQSHATVLLVTCNGSKIARVLKGIGFDCEINPVIVVEQDGLNITVVQLSAELRAARINVLNAYTCCSGSHGPLVVLNTTECSRAVRTLETMYLRPVRPLGESHDRHADAAVVEPVQMRG
jgi:hypothetical protein